MAKMLLLQGFILNFTCVRHYFLYVEFNDFYVNQSLAGQTIERKLNISFQLNFNARLTHESETSIDSI
jgi:hypothetical protein